MRIAHALDFLHASNAAQFESLSDLIPPDLITTLLDEKGVATLRRRRMPMERLVWAIIGMAIFRHVPMTQLVNQLDILLPGDRPFVAPSAFLHARQKLGDKSIERLFHETASLWHQQANHLGWAGLQLLAVDGVMWHTPDTPDNAAAFAKPGTRHGETAYPQVRMLCQMVGEQPQADRHVTQGCRTAALLGRNAEYGCEIRAIRVSAAPARVRRGEVMLHLDDQLATRDMASNRSPKVWCGSVCYHWC
ncbi:transposase [Aeromonas veronii bv. veronii]|nr:Putative IS4 transposase; KpLE2 phage-like element [Aeromonas veronii B565]EKB14197.1 hypothetical protein HMPREF1169_01475 [Aeromonas veronii AER397]EKB21996.1 hypothetical protein HMPREF1170_02258 [Aeromonas veronii AMC35]OKP35684.1 transposase [Aeromonas veronii bv. veronii]